MKKVFRLKKKNEIDKVFLKKNSTGDSFFSVFCLKNTNKHFRFAISIGKKYGNAVHRNLIKRQIRQIISQLKNVFLNYDFVVVVKPKANILKYVEINNMIKQMLVKIKILKFENNTKDVVK